MLKRHIQYQVLQYISIILYYEIVGLFRFIILASINYIGNHVVYLLIKEAIILSSKMHGNPTHHGVNITTFDLKNETR